MRTTALRQRQGERQGLSLTQVHLLLLVFNEFFWSFFLFVAFLFWKGANEVTAQSGEKVKGARRTKLRNIRQTCKRLYLRAGQCDQGTGRQRSHHRTLSSATSHSGLLQRGKTTPCLHTLPSRDMDTSTLSPQFPKVPQDSPALVLTLLVSWLSGSKGTCFTDSSRPVSAS